MSKDAHLYGKKAYLCGKRDLCMSKEAYLYGKRGLLTLANCPCAGELLTTECVPLLQNVFSYHRMCSLTTECVLLLQNVFSYYRMCSLTTGSVLLLQHVSCAGEPLQAVNAAGLYVFSYYRMCSLTIECVLLL